MINPTFKDTITVFHQEGHLNTATNRTVTIWKRNLYTDCYFGVNNVETLNGNTLSQASSYTVRIPYANEAININSGDIVVLGKVNDTIADVQGNRASDIISKYKPNCFTVRTVKDNTKILHGSHYKLIGA